MSRIRTGLSPDAWRDDGPATAHAHGYIASAARHGYALTGGALVQGESERAHDLRLQRESMKRRRAR